VPEVLRGTRYWHDTGTTENGEKVLHDSSGEYAYWNHPTDGLIVSAVADVGGSPVDYFKELPPEEPPIVDAGGYTLTYTSIDATTTSVTGYTGTPVAVVVPEIADGGRAVVSIGEDCFRFCQSLVSIDVPDSVISFEDYAFNNCSSLSTVSMPSTIKSFGWMCFRGCLHLTEITFPESVTSIDGYCLVFCSELSTIVFKGDAPTLGDGVFYNTPATIYYPSTATGYTNPWGGRPTVAYVPGTLTGFGSFSGSLTVSEHVIADAWYRAETTAFESLASFLGCTEGVNCFRGFLPVQGDAEDYLDANVWQMTSGSDGGFEIEDTFGADALWCSLQAGARIESVWESRADAMKFAGAVMAWLKQTGNLNEVENVTWCTLSAVPDEPKITRTQGINRERFWEQTIDLTLTYRTENVYT